MQPMARRYVSILALLTCCWASPILAIENYSGTVQGQCVTYQGTTYNAVAEVTAPSWTLKMLSYAFHPSPGQFKTEDQGTKVRYFQLPPGQYKVIVGDPVRGQYSIQVPDCEGGQKGLTWRFAQISSTAGTVRVGCGYSNGDNECNPYQGDTPCSAALPLLCIRKEGPGFPLPPPTAVDNSNLYSKWAGGVIGTTLPVVPPETLAKANDLCSQVFGEHWRVAQHHDGWGWYFQAYGGAGDLSQRFWVHIRDQPGALCWR